MIKPVCSVIITRLENTQRVTMSTLYLSKEILHAAVTKLYLSILLYFKSLQEVDYMVSFVLCLGNIGLLTI